MLCPSCGASADDSNAKTCRACGAGLARTRSTDEYLGKKVAQKYRIEALIGEGGMGRVYRARQLALDKQVVLKVLHPSLLSDERTVARFHREAKAASRLNHPNSINVLDFGQTEDGSLYIAMELVHGKDLHYLLAKEWPLAEARIVRIVSQVLSALADAHAAGVIHRDLKPENIMVEQRRQEPDFVKVLDFGIAKIQDTARDAGPALTRAGFVCGTPEYMSPEQARGAPLDARSDLYTVGILLYQLATGLLPFQADSAVGWASKHLNEEPQPPTKRRPEVKLSPGLERLILRALSKDPGQRPPSAEAFLAELMAVAPDRRQAAARRAGQSAAPARRAVTTDDEETHLTSTRPWQGTEVTLRTESGRRPPPLAAAAPTEALRAQRRRLASSTVVRAGALTFAAMLFGLGGVYALRLVPRSNSARPASEPARGEDVRLAQRLIPPQERDPVASARWVRKGNMSQEQGQLELAASQYQRAFELDPTPAISLKLGELRWVQGRPQEARAWWQRHLRDEVGSEARGQIEERLSGGAGRSR